MEPPKRPLSLDVLLATIYFMGKGLDSLDLPSTTFCHWASRLLVGTPQRETWD